MSVTAGELHYLDLLEVGDLIHSRMVSAREVTEAVLQRIDALDGELRSYVRVLARSARIEAERADREIAAGHHRGPLHGVPIAVKDLCWIAGEPTAAGTTVYRDFVPAEDATVVERLRTAGAVLIGKPQLTEGAYSDHHPSVAPPRNPWNPAYWPGISSSGSGVATAAGLCFGSIASDTGGSIRWPSAANGVTGLKPTWGRVSRHGVFELAASLDHVGTMARSVADAAALLGAIAGSDPRDPTALPPAVPNYLALPTLDLRGVRIGIDAAWNSDGVDAQTQTVLEQALACFRQLGATLVDVRVPDVGQIVEDWVPNCAVEAAVAHEAAYDLHREQFGSVLASVIETGRSLSALAYQRILLRRARFRGEVERLFGTVDLLATPVQPFAPLSLAAIATLGEQPELIAALQRYTCPFDMSGHPTLTLPGGFADDGMPIGFQLVAANLEEGALVRVGAAFQGRTDWHRRRPDLAMSQLGGRVAA